MKMKLLLQRMSGILRDTPAHTYPSKYPTQSYGERKRTTGLN